MRTRAATAHLPAVGRDAADFELATRDLIIVAEHTAAHEADMAETDAIGYPRSRFVILIESRPFLVRSVAAEAPDRWKETGRVRPGNFLRCEITKPTVRDPRFAK